MSRYTEQQLIAAKRAAHEAACEAYSAKLQKLIPELQVPDLADTGHRAVCLILMGGEPVLMLSEYTFRADKHLIAEALIAEALAARASGTG